MYKSCLRISLVLLLQVLICKAFAQNYNCGNISIDSAELRYNVGRFDECITGLTECLQTKKAFNADQKVQALHILGKCYLAMDSINRADSVIEELLALRENFETDLNDPDRFVNRVLFIRSTVISSVSKRNEDIRLAPATTAVITEEEIRQRGYSDLIQILQDIPGFDVSIYYGQLYANVYQRGLRTNNTDKTLLLVDGVEENDLWTNFADISQQYPITNIKRIEVIYGPASTMYGPTAFSGVINIITKEPSDYLSHKESFGINVSTGVATYNTRFFDASAAYKKNGFSFSVTGRFYYSDRPKLADSLWDYDPNDYDNEITNNNYRRIYSIDNNANEYIIANNLPYQSPYYRINNDLDKLTINKNGIEEIIRRNKALYEEGNINFDYTDFVNPSKSYYINARMNFSNFSLGFVSWNKNEGIGTTYTDVVASVNGSRWITGHDYLYLKYNKRISDKLLFTAFANYRIHAIKNGSKIVTKKDYTLLGGLTLKDLVDGVPASWLTTYYYEQSEQFRSEFKLLYTPNKNFYLNSGIELRNSQLQGYYLTSTISSNPQNDGTAPSLPGGNQFNVNDVGIYSQGNYRTKFGLGITLGARLDYDEVRSGQGLGNHLSPRFVLDYTTHDYIFKAIVSSGIENVSNFTKFDDVNIVPNLNLKPETIYNYEFSVTKKFSDVFSADIDLFYSRVKDVVSAVISNHVLQNQNVGEYKIKGIQSNIYFRSLNKKIQATLNYTYTDPHQNRLVDENDTIITDNRRVADIAKNKINGIVNLVVLKNFNINIRANYLSSKKDSLGTSVPNNKIRFDGYFLCNTTISANNFIKGISVQLGCNNLFNKTYASPGIRTAGGIRVPNQISQMGRNFFLRLNYEL